ncbi:Glyoxal reductase [compost metagenome]
MVQAWSPLGSGRILDNEVLLSLAQKYNVSVGQICIKFALQEGINPLPKSTNPINIKANLDLSNFELTAEDIALIKNMGDLGFSGLNPAEVPF